MTTLDPGASVVLTHGLVVSPRSTAFLASSAAPIITCGLEVLVQEVIAAITTWPWSTNVSVPSSMTTRVGLEFRSPTTAPCEAPCGLPEAPVPCAKGLAGVAVAGREGAGRVGGREGLLDRLVDAGPGVAGRVVVVLLHLVDRRVR